MGAAVVGAGATVIGSSNAAKAANKAGDLQYQASQDAIASQERIYNQTRADNEPRRVIGDSALSALAGGMGLPVSMTSAAPSYASTPVPGVGGISMTGKPAGGAAGTSPLAPAPDWTQYGAAHPDVVAGFQAYQNGNAQGFGGANEGQNWSDWGYAPGMTQDQFLQQYQDTTGQAAGYQVPTAQTPVSAPTMTGGATGPAPGYTDPTAPGGYTPGARPDAGPAPAAYTAPARQAIAGPDLSLASFRTSPDYTFQVQEMEKALGNASSSMGGVMSGQRVKAALDRSRNLADGEYTDWRNFTAGQANIDRARQDAIYADDRGFGYGQNRDATGDFERTRARSDGLYADDRARTDTRYDTRNSTLLSMAGFGAQAAGQNQSAATSFAQNQGNLTMTGAQARGNAATGAASAWNQGIGNLMTSGAYLAGNYLGGGSTPGDWASMGAKTGAPWYAGLGVGG